MNLKAFILLLLFTLIPCSSLATAEDTVRIIVQFTVNGEGHNSAQRVLRNKLSGEDRVIRRFSTIPFAVLEVSASTLKALEDSPQVISIQEDRLHRPALNESVPLIEADAAHAVGYDGKGQSVVILDTGVDGNHPNLAGKIVDEACFASGHLLGNGSCLNGKTSDFGFGSGAPCTYSDTCFHGTHVAGIAVGRGVEYSGVAPGATLISIQVFSEFPPGERCGGSPCALSWNSDQIAALEYVFKALQHIHTIASVNISIGGKVYTSQNECDAANPARKAAIDNLRSVGIATIIAAGNDEFVNAISEPACISSAVSVSATNKRDEIAGFSNAASFLSLWAPGVGIMAPLYRTTDFARATGTSMSAPHVAGAWAILRQAAPSASVSEILTAFQTTGKPIHDVLVDTSRIRVHPALMIFVPEPSSALLLSTGLVALVVLARRRKIN